MEKEGSDALEVAQEETEEAPKGSEAQGRKALIALRSPQGLLFQAGAALGMCFGHRPVPPQNACSCFRILSG